MKAKGWLVFGGVVAVIAVLAALAVRTPWFGRLTGRSGELANGYYTVFDETGQAVLTTSIAVNRGDFFVNGANRSFRIEQVRGRQATARFTGVVVPSTPPATPTGSIAAAAARRGQPQGDTPATALPVGERPKLIVLYSTHTDESYIPTDGAANNDRGGGVLKVSQALGTMLSVRGFEVVTDKTSHLPHDANAYIRSRRTVMQYLMKDQPYALYDIHRDTPPAGEYRVTVEGRTVAKTLIVIGRQNPLQQVNRYEAERIKATADRLYPGLIRGIYFATGSYNQELDAGLLLFEIGTQAQPREEAELGAGYLGNVITAALSGQ